MKFRFDENDDLVIDDIPDDLEDMTRRLAFERRVSVEDIWRDIVMRLVSADERRA